MRSFAGVGDRFLKEMATLDGPTIRGVIMPASDQEGSPFEFSSPRVVLSTRVESAVVPGFIIVTQGGPRYLVGDHFAAEADYRSWRLFLVEKQYAWARTASTTDALTGLAKNSGAPVSLGSIWASIEHDRRMFTDPGLKLKTERVTLITNSPVLQGDLVDGQIITRVTRDLGLYIAEHQ